MSSNKLATYETYNAAAWCAESEAGDFEEVPVPANNVEVRPPVVRQEFPRSTSVIRGTNTGRGGRGRSINNATRGRGRGTDSTVRGRGRGTIDGGSGRNGSHRGGGVTRGNSRGNAGRGGHHSVPTGRGNGRLFEIAPRGGHSRDGTGSSSHAPSDNHRADQELPRRLVKKVREPGLNSSTGWAVPAGLMTEAKKLQLENEQSSRTNTALFLEKPLDGEVFSAVGFYQWPVKGINPEDLFGEQLKDLDHLKTSWKVFIQWNCARSWLAISALPPSTQTTIIEVIKGIRQAADSAHTRINMEETVFIVVPPRFSTESTLLEASISFVKDQKRASGIKFSKMSSNEELNRQTPRRSLKVEATVEKFRTVLSKYLNELTHIKDRMQMRVHFGELHLTRWQTVLIDGEQDWDAFTKMMTRKGARGVFEKAVDPQAVIHMMADVKSKLDKFMVWSSTDYDLQDVKPKFVAILAVQNSSGQMFEIQADIDTVYGGYQCGVVKVVEEERRNKCVEIVTVDIEQVDWTIEIISETAGTVVDSSFQDLVQSCLQPYVRTGLNTRRMEERKDKYGFVYPRITPRVQAGLRVEKVTLQSIYRFKTQKGGYCLEFTINRNWDGLSTVAEPDVCAGVTVFHDLWDTDMEANDHTTMVRDWQRDMSNFFPAGGFEDFVEELDGLLLSFHHSMNESRA
ncbi:uncharacterized protein EAE97_002175 [Botrytis byssoidea]|uniref:DUF7905 domain-containing protein n=1 Tax=Botrytis byssoidea TaxID=139641 RepID=A0A9P5ITB6_9HELO|nr:uncharacterized protein EAE97_002175 [Botrytis byssoidea]KAF7950623.1 hypothetical protein EAE97_002175 [Botrytis byssoidea]